MKKMLIALACLAFFTPVRAQTPSVPRVSPKTPPPSHVVAVVSPFMVQLAKCESQGNIKAKVLDVNGKYSYGKYQWQMASWINYKKLGAVEDNIFDEQMQDTVTKYVLDHGGWRNWYNCTIKIRGA
jgi:hypothetical protein